MTNKQRVFIGEIAKGATLKDAALVAYDTNEANASKMGHQVMNALEVSFPEALDRAGATDAKVAAVVMSALDATNTYYSKAKQDFIEGADWLARLKAADMIMKVKRHYPKEAVDVEHSYSFVVTRGDEPATLEAIVVEPDGTDGASPVDESEREGQPTGLEGDNVI